MTNPIATRTLPVTLSDGRTIAVRELSWVEITELSTLLIAEFQKLAEAGLPGEHQAVNKLITGSRTISTWLIEKTADLPPGMGQTVGARDGMAILNAAIELNLTDELIDLGKSIAGRVMKWIPAGTLKIPGQAG